MPHAVLYQSVVPFKVWMWCICSGPSISSRGLLHPISQCGFTEIKQVHAEDVVNDYGFYDV